MNGWIYLIRNKDIYKIGITRNFEKRMRQLKPDNVVAKLYTSNYIELEREFHNRYKRFRIPQTEYFRLEKSHLKEIKKRISYLDNSIEATIEILTKSFFFLLCIFLLVFIFIALNINDVNIVFSESILWMKKLSFCFSFLSLFVNSGHYLSFLNELKYRSIRLFVFTIFGVIFRIASLLLK